MMGVSGSFVTDDVNTYAVTSEVKIDESKNGVTYTPLVEVRRPGSDNMALTGMVTMETAKSATVDLTLAGVTAQPLSFKSKPVTSGLDIVRGGGGGGGRVREVGREGGIEERGMKACRRYDFFFGGGGGRNRISVTALGCVYHQDCGSYTQSAVDFAAAMTNTKKEISLTGSVANGDKNEYSVRVGTQLNIASNKKAAKIQVHLLTSFFLFFFFFSSSFFFFFSSFFFFFCASFFCYVYGGVILRHFR